jgi:hypothetical protein
MKSGAPQPCMPNNESQPWTEKCANAANLSQEQRIVPISRQHMQICRTWPCSKLLHRAGIESLQAAANIHSTLAACRQATQKCAAAVVPADCAEHLTVLSQHTSGAAHPANVLHCRTKYARTTKQSMLDTALANSKRGNPGVTPQGGMKAGWRAYTNQFSHLARPSTHAHKQTRKVMCQHTHIRHGCA